MDRVDDGAGLRQTHAMADTLATTYPTRVDKPDLGLVLGTLLRKHLRVHIRVQGKESLAVAGREGQLWFSNAHFSSSNLGCVTRDEMVHGLLWVELGHRWQDTVCVTGEEDNVLGVTTDGWNLDVSDMLERVAHTSVWRQADVVVVDDTRFALLLVVAGILNDSAKFDGIENVRLLSAGKTIGLSIAATLDVEHIFVRPDVLIVTDQQTLGVGRQSGLARA